MTSYSDPMLISCPHCSALSELEPQLRSMSVFFSFSWTDGAVSPNGDPRTSALSDFIRRCWSCHHYFWIREAQRECAAPSLGPPNLTLEERFRAKKQELEELRKIYGERLPPARSSDRHEEGVQPSATGKAELEMAIEDGIARNSNEALALYKLCFVNSNGVIREAFLDGVRDYFPSRRHRWSDSEAEQKDDNFLQWDEERYFEMLRLLRSREVSRSPFFDALTRALLELLDDNKPETILLRAELHRERAEHDACVRELGRLDGVDEVKELVRFQRRLLKEDLVIPVVIPYLAGGSPSKPSISIRL